MCDEQNLKQWAKGQMNRRQFGVVAGAGALAACAPGEVVAGGDTQSSANSGTEVGFATKDGTMDARFFAAPNGPAPAVIHWPDIAGIRASHISMAQRTAAEGYSVLLVNPYYRDATGVIWPDFASFADGGWDRARAMRSKLSSQAVKSDTQGIISWLDAQEGVDTARGIGAEGYCMGGPFTVYSAHANSERVKAAASFHGGGLVRDDDPESPHILLAQTTGHYLFAIAKNDDAKAPTDKTELRAASEAAGRPAKITVYEGDHGWTVPDSPSYVKEAAELAFADKLALYKTAL
ncbi:MAG: dienelactone hydrolase family protein [Erythrobacter sp.]